MVLDVTVAVVAWHVLTAPGPSPQRAVTRAAALAESGEFAQLYSSLCPADRQRFSEAELSTAGRTALLALGGVSGVRITRVVPVPGPGLGVLRLAARRVFGELVPVVGAPSAFSVTVLDDPGGWQVCLSLGGYSSARLGIDVPPVADTGP